MKKGETKWTTDKIMTAISQSAGRRDFGKRFPGALKAAEKSKEGLQFFYDHMPLRKRFWTTEALHLVASGYSNRSSFARGDRSAYGTAWKRGLLDEVCSHMTPRNKPVDRYVYSISSIDGSTVYIGLTVDPIARIIEHRTRGTAKVRALVAGEHNYDVLFGPIPEKDAVRIESDLIEGAKEDGRDVLNIHKGGNTGNPGARYWTEDIIAKEAIKYTTRKGFQNGCAKAYSGALRHPLGIDYFCAHMIPAHNTWTYESIALEALKHKTRSEFAKKGKGAYAAATIHFGGIAPFVTHMAPPIFGRRPKPANDNAPSAVVAA